MPNQECGLLVIGKSSGEGEDAGNEATKVIELTESPLENDANVCEPPDRMSLPHSPVLR